MSEPLRIWEPAEGDRQLCGVCVDGIVQPAFPYALRMGRDGSLRRYYEWKADPRPTEEQQGNLRRYLEEPKCTPGRHRWYEEREMERLRQELDDAQTALRRAHRLKQGWSIEAPSE